MSHLRGPDGGDMEDDGDVLEISGEYQDYHQYQYLPVIVLVIGLKETKIRSSGDTKSPYVCPVSLHP